MKQNNPYYGDIKIDQQRLIKLPISGIPSDLRVVEENAEENNEIFTEEPEEEHEHTHEIDKNIPELIVESDDEMLIESDLEDCFQDVGVNDDEETMNDMKNFVQAPSVSFVPVGETEVDQENTILKLLNGVDKEKPQNANWVPQGGIVSDWQTEGICSMAFPTLFPDGKGDPTVKDRNSRPKWATDVKRLMLFAEKQEDGSYYWRFAQHKMFMYWAFNFKRRKQLFGSHWVYKEKNTSDQFKTTEDIKKRIKKYWGLH